MISRAHALQPSSAEATEHDVPIGADSRAGVIAAYLVIWAVLGYLPDDAA